MHRPELLACPRDRKLLRDAKVGEAAAHLCATCSGIFVETDALFAAAGIDADPSAWDRPETGGAVKRGALPCPRCGVPMAAQDVAHDGRHVEIDRCGKCRAIWLDEKELDTLVAIGQAMRPILDRERTQAREALATMPEPELQGFVTKKRLVIALVALPLVALLAMRVYEWNERRLAALRVHHERQDDTKEGGCPCGCDRSKAMAAELRSAGGASAAVPIDETLATIASRESLGYVTERMIEHRLRMLDLGHELGLDVEAHATTSDRCASARVEREGLRVCADLVVHGERWEAVRGAPKLIESSFRVWLEIENRGDELRRLAMPAVDAGRFHMPPSRWYREGTAGEPWDGALPAHATVRVNVVGYVVEPVVPGAAIDGVIALGPTRLPVRTTARANIHQR